MMLGVSGLMESSGAAAVETHESGGGSGGSSEAGGGGSSSIPGIEESGGGSRGGGNRWPRQETLALLKIRFDMDVAFRDSSLKGPLWDEVSRKLAELGFQRSAKKCKEKFENVYKYHKRTKDGRTSKPDGKSYRFFDQLEALENSPPVAFTPPSRPQPPPPVTTTMTAPPVSTMPPNITVSSATPSPTPLTIIPPNPNTQINPSLSHLQNSQPQPILNTTSNTNQPQNHIFHHPSNPLLSNSTSSSTSSDEDIHRRRGRKRKWKEYFERLMKDVVHKQEELQKKFLDTLEKRERERATREEAWRVQEMARMNRDHDLLVQERSIAAAKDAAVIAFLQKVSEQQNLQIPMITSTNTIVVPPAPAMQVRPPPENPQTPRQPPPTPPPQQTNPPPPPPAATQPVQQPQPPPALMVTPVSKRSAVEASKTDNNNGGDNFLPPSSSRWPKAEVQALINLRTSLDLKYQDNGPKGPLWEEISSAMAKIGYNRSSKRCKEKWENINKYYKKVKESNKKRPEDSKTCPYFHQLEAIYKDRAKNEVGTFNPVSYVKPDNPMTPIMARPEQQWPMPDQHQQNPNRDSAMHDLDQDNDSDDNNDGDEEEEDEDEDDGGGFEIMASKQLPSSGTNTQTV